MLLILYAYENFYVLSIYLLIYFYYFCFNYHFIPPFPLPWQQFSSLETPVLNQSQIWRFLLKLTTNFSSHLLLLLNQMSTRRELRDIVPGTPAPKICSKSKSPILPFSDISQNIIYIYIHIYRVFLKGLYKILGGIGHITRI